DAISAASYDDGGTLVIDRAGVREYLNSIAGYSGIIGVLTCDDFGDCGSQRISVIQHNDSSDWQAGTANVVFTYNPASSAQVGDIAAAVDLASVCPSPIVIQTDWFPEAEHGAMYELGGEGYTMDADNMVVRGPGQLGGVPLGIDIEIRTGGPAIGWSPVSSHVYTDDSITLGYASTDSQILQFGDTPMMSVVAPLEKNPQMIMWDPGTYPDVHTIADLGEQGIIINIFGGGTFSSVFVAEGIWSEDQVDPSYDGSPAVFVASEGEVAQQGFASAEPYQYEHVYEEWGKPVRYQLLHDAGFPVYSQNLGIRVDDLESLRPCLELFVPVVQQAVVDYDASPERANAIIVDAVVTFDSFWSYDMDLAAFSHATQRNLGLIGNGPDSTVGNMEASRIQAMIDKEAAAGMDFPDGLTVDQLMTNEFIDMSIGFPEPDYSSFDANGDGVIRIGVAAAGPADDGAYYQAVVDAAIELSAALGFEDPIVVDEIQAADAATELSNLAEQGVDIIVVGASEIAEPLPDLTEKYPDIFWYCNCGAGFETLPGLAQTTDDSSEISYSAGYASGLLLQDRGDSSAAFIGCCDLGFEKEAFLAFEMGLQAVDPSFTVTYVPTGAYPYDFDNVPNATEAFNNAVATGVGVVYPYLGGAHEPVVQLANESGVAVLSAGASDVCTREGDVSWDIAVRFDGGDYVAAVFPQIFDGRITEGDTKMFRVGVDPEPGAIICNATAEQQAAMDAVYAEIASGAFAGEFGAIKGAAYGG
ncbi:MAG: BMP family ABC transporter substrate-binding protein, partial [Acidimicrobiales bacterium]|nr:BMP family ABC transporter substrate-binding protein [Acidimicrobiales bacterium]